MKSYFQRLARTFLADVRGREVATCYFVGEDTTFCRFNQSLVRQTGEVRDRALALTLVDGDRSVTETISVTGDEATDQTEIVTRRDAMRALLPSANVDPHLAYATEVRSSTQEGVNLLPDARALMVETVLPALRGTDAVGVYTAGAIYRGFANSFGQENWFASYPFSINFTIYAKRDKAVKEIYAGEKWDSHAFRNVVERAREHVDRLHVAPKSLEPGQYRAYLAPRAVAEIIGIMCWGGFSCQAHRSKTSPLMGLSEHPLSGTFALTEFCRDGSAPAFTAAGFVRPDSVALIRGGKIDTLLVSPRSGKEFSIEHTGANGDESPESLALEAGNLANNDVLAALDRGLYISDLWYLNYSDRPAARVTGMTRFASFWVENGRIVAPLDVMRFDDTLDRVFGSKLAAMTSDITYVPDDATYGPRSPGSTKVPGALVKELRLVL